MSAASIQLKCPSNYNKEKFNKILILYDKLDKNGDHVVVNNELKEISNLHFNNKILFFDQKKKKIIGDFNADINRLNLLKKQQVASLELDYEYNIKLINNKKDKNLNFCKNTIERYKSLSIIEKSNKFMEVISDNKGYVDFWKFFEYLKDKTDDIDNIIIN